MEPTIPSASEHSLYGARRAVYKSHQELSNASIQRQRQDMNSLVLEQKAFEKTLRSHSVYLNLTDPNSESQRQSFVTTVFDVLARQIKELTGIFSDYEKAHETFVSMDCDHVEESTTVEALKALTQTRNSYLSAKRDFDAKVDTISGRSIELLTGSADDGRTE